MSLTQTRGTRRAQKSDNKSINHNFAEFTIATARTSALSVQIHLLYRVSNSWWTARRFDFCFRSISKPTCIFSLLYTVIEISSISYPYQCLFAPLAQKGMGREKIIAFKLLDCNRRTLIFFLYERFFSFTQHFL